MNNAGPKMFVSHGPQPVIVLPASNEEKNGGVALQQALEPPPARAEEFQVIVVDGGSRDGTASVVEELRGYGATVRTGLRKARSSPVLYTNANNQFDIGELWMWRRIYFPSRAMLDEAAQRAGLDANAVEVTLSR